jgi:glutamate synthase (NADPH) large chain
VPPDRAAHPILDNDELAKLLHIDDDGGPSRLPAVVVDGLYPVAEGGDGLRGRSTGDPPDR